MPTNYNLNCPIPLHHYPQIMMAHGGGGTLMHELIQDMFIKTFGNDSLQHQLDSACFDFPYSRMAMTTDSYVVKPIEFLGGDIGSLSVHGTVNDLSMVGAKPMYISLGMILEEGLSMDLLWKITQSIKKAADYCDVKIVTGDTKVVDKGKGDQIYINTTGVGYINHSVLIHPKTIKDSDCIIISGDIARHGMAIMAQREHLAFDTTIDSDSAPLNHMVQELISEGIEIHCMRDLTRGGLASALNEIVSVTQMGIEIEEEFIPIRDDVKTACELLGYDPLYVACEGRMILFIAEEYVDKTIHILKKHPYGKDSKQIGKVNNKSLNKVVMRGIIGSSRIVDMLSGEQLPRIC